MTGQKTEQVHDKVQKTAQAFESHHNTTALHEVDKDMKGMSASARGDYFRELRGATQGHNLPGLEISENAQHQMKVTEREGGKNKVLLDESKPAGQPGERHPDRPGGERQPPAAGTERQPKPAGSERQPGTPGADNTDPRQPRQPDAATGAPQDGFTGGLRKGEGPYQALQRQHPEYSHKQLLDAAHQIIKESGRHEFKQGEQFKANDDGSVTSRTQGAGTDGAYSETTSKGGKVSETKTGTADGKWTSQKYDENGNKGESTEHTPGANGDYSETTKDATGTKTLKQVNHDATGTKTDTYDDAGNQTGSIKESPDQKQKIGWSKNADGSVTSYDQTDPDNHTETITNKDGTTSSKQTEKTADGSKVTTQDKTGTTTDTFDATNKQTSFMHVNPDGSGHGERKNADGSLTVTDQKDSNHFTETTKNGNDVVSTKTTEKNGSGRTEVTKDNQGNTNTDTYDLNGSQTSGVRENGDGATGWHKLPKGGIEHFDRNKQGDYQSMTFDQQGHLTRTEDRKQSGESTVQEQLTPNVIRTYQTVKGKFNSIVTKVPTDSMGTLKGPDA